MINLIQPITVQQAYDGITHTRRWASWHWWWRMVDDDDGDGFPSPEPRTDSRSALPRGFRAWRRLRIVKRDDFFSLIFSPWNSIYGGGGGVGEATGGPWGRGRTLGGGGRHHPRGALVSFPDCYLFFYFSKYSKMEKYCLKNCFGVGLLTVPHTYSFSESETFRKVSLMCYSGVTISIILVSTFMGLPEI